MGTSKKPIMTLRRRVIVAEPENSETPINDLRSWVTPNRLFFVRNHFDVPEIDPASWTLRVGGCVERELELGWAEIEQLPTRSVFATMECAGNGRSFLEKPGHGVQWGAGAVGHAEWTGPTLRAVLDQAGITDQALEVVFAGADRGTEADHPQTMSFARSLPLDKALHEDTLLATAMNGEPLDPAHGFPVRLVVPGWYGVASVKWLTRIELSDKPFQGYFQTTKYTTLRQTARGAVEEVVGEMQHKSEILRPREGETLGVGLNRILGAAWAGPRPCGRGGGQHRRRPDLVPGRASRDERKVFMDIVGVLMATRPSGSSAPGLQGHLRVRPSATAQARSALWRLPDSPFPSG